MSFQHYSLLVFDDAGVATFPLAGVFAPPLGLRLAGVRATFLGLSSSEVKGFVGVHKETSEKNDIIKWNSNHTNKIRRVDINQIKAFTNTMHFYFAKYSCMKFHTHIKKN